MNKFRKRVVGLLGLFMAFSIVGCAENVEYGEEYNLETDYQYSYDCSVLSWRDVQSDGKRQYIYKDNYIYYYDMNSQKFIPLCNKANCLHNKEKDDKKRGECNAYASEGDLDYGEVTNTCKNMQYYDGNIYYVRANNLYRIKKDGSKKDKLLTLDEELPINHWIIHRGVFYYEIEPFFYGEDKDTQIYTKCILKSLNLSNKMKEKNSKIIFESNEDNTSVGFGPITAYKDYLCFGYISNTKDFNYETNEEWLAEISPDTYLYNIKKNELSLIKVPEGYNESTIVNSVNFLEDKIIISLYDLLKDESEKLPIYFMDYNLTNERILIDDISQYNSIQIYDNYIIFRDIDFQQSKNDNQETCNYMIYDSKGNKVSEYICPTYGSVDNRGFGPDGVQILFKENENDYDVYQLNFEDVLNLSGDEVVPKQMGKILNMDDNL